MIELSYWEKSFLEEKIDICIVGAGIVGLQAAIRMKTLQPACRVAVLDQHLIPRGASIRNAGFACIGSMTELLQDEEEQGIEEVEKLVEKRWKGLGKLTASLGEKSIGYQPNPGYEVFLPGEEKVYEKCRAQLDKFNDLFSQITGIPQAFRPAPEEIGPLGLRNISQLIRHTAEGQIHTGKMMNTLMEKARSVGVEFRMGWKLESWNVGSAGLDLFFSEGLRLSCQKLLVATNGFTRRLFPSLELLPARNQVLLTSPIPTLALKGSFHYHQGYVYFRNVGDRLLIGGARHLDREGESTDLHGSNEPIKNYLVEFMNRHVLSSPGHLAYEWTGILGVGGPKKPIIEWVEEHILLAVRLGGMGVAIGSQVGEEAADELMRHL